MVVAASQTKEATVAGSAASIETDTEDQRIEEVSQQAPLRRRKRRHQYTDDELASLARTADQQIRLGETFVSAAHRLNLAVPTLRKAFEKSGIVVPSRGRRPKFPRRIAPADDIRQSLQIIETADGASKDQMVTVQVPLRDLVKQNRVWVIEFLLSDREDKVKTAVRLLLEHKEADTKAAARALLDM